MFDPRGIDHRYRHPGTLQAQCECRMLDTCGLPVPRATERPRSARWRRTHDTRKTWPAAVLNSTLDLSLASSLNRTQCSLVFKTSMLIIGIRKTLPTKINGHRSP